MAGDWIKLEHSTPDKPEVFRIAETLSIAPEHALGCLVRVWMWADQQIAEGNAVSVTETSLDRIARVSGFGSAMLSVGWLTTSDDGIAFPNFDRHNGQTAKTRALTAKRVAKCKAGKGNAEVTPDALPREEKRREETENNVGEVSPTTPQHKRRQRRIPVTADDIMRDLEIPPELGHDTRAKQAIRDWLEHKDRIKTQYASHKSFSVELRRWARVGASRFAAAVEYSIGKEYKGIFEENGNGRSGTSGGHQKSAADGWKVGPGQRYQGPDDPPIRGVEVADPGCAVSGRDENLPF